MMSNYIVDDSSATAKQKDYLKALYIRHEGLDEKTATKRAEGIQTVKAASAEIQRILDGRKKKAEKLSEVESFKFTKTTELFRGSLDYAEFVIDPKNKDSTPGQIGDVVGNYMTILRDEDWSMFRLELLKELREIRKKAERRE